MTFDWIERFARTTSLRTSSLGRIFAALGLGVVTISFWTAWYGGTWQVSGGDYSKDYGPAMSAILAGHVKTFFETLPTNGAGGSVLLRAPFALLGKTVVGDELAVYRFGSLACLLVLGGVGLWLACGMASRSCSLSTRVGLVALFASAPALLQAVYYGHPEEPLGAALAIGAVVAAGAERPLLAGSLLGAAVLNKPWGVFAIAPVLLCVPRHRARVLLPAGTVVGGWLSIGALLAQSRLIQSVHGAETSLVAHPQDLWWPLARTVGYYPIPPAFLSAHARQLAVLVAAGAALAVAVRMRPLSSFGVQRSLALLAFGFALRCLLEPAPHDYYELPFLVTLASWEVRARASVSLSLAALFVLALDFRRLDELAPAIPYAVYLAVILPTSFVLIADIFGAGERAALMARFLISPRRIPRG